MKEQLYTIPVNDAFQTDCECPLCKLYDDLEKETIDFVMGPSYMEDDIRMETDRTGFCSAHIRQMYQYQNRLGLALMLHTHMKCTYEMIQSLSHEGTSPKGFFRKKETDPFSEFLSGLDSSCYVCNRIKPVFARYLETVLYCYDHDREFASHFRNSKGLCTRHFGMLRECALHKWSGQKLEHFLNDLNQIYLENMKRVTDDLEWFIDKFDYRNEDAPWKNSRDALPRSINKTNSITRLE